MDSLNNVKSDCSCNCEFKKIAFRGGSQTWARQYPTWLKKEVPENTIGVSPVRKYTNYHTLPETYNENEVEKMLNK